MNYTHFIYQEVLECDNQFFEQYSTEKFCFNENLFTYSRTLDGELTSEGCFEKK